MPEFDDFVDGLTEITDPGASDNVPITRGGAPYRVKPTNLGLTEPLTSLLPLGKVGDSVGFGSPGLYEPASTDSDDGAWIAFDWNSGVFTFATGLPTTAPKAIIKSQADVVEFLVEQQVDDAFISMQVSEGSTRAYIAMQAMTGQTHEMFDVADENGNSVFVVEPDGALSKLNGVTVPITGVPVTAAGVHAALVTLGLITA